MIVSNVGVLEVVGLKRLFRARHVEAGSMVPITEEREEVTAFASSEKF